MEKREDKLVRLIREQDLIEVKTKKDKYRFQKLQSQINKIENQELQTIK